MAYKILLAEDDELQVWMLRHAFTKARLEHQIVSVEDGEMAIQYLEAGFQMNHQTNYPLPKLILLDLKMPKVDGFGVLKWMQSRPERDLVPVVVLTCSTLPEDVRRAKDLGAREVLQKPNGLEELVTMVQTMNERWLT